MLGTLGLTTLEALIDRAVPAAIRITEPLALPEAMSERETVSYLRRMRDRNRVFISMLGMGYYGTVVPAVIRRNVLENPVGTRLIPPTRPRLARAGSRRF